MGVVQQTACLVVSPVAVDGFAALFGCAPVGRALDLMMAPAWGYQLSLLGLGAVFGRAHRGSAV